jgi:23S rRNA pseudouridine2604 synthase
MTEPVRLAKRLAEEVSCSRREAEQYIEGGWVTVDGIVVEEPGSRVQPQQQVVLAPKASLDPVQAVTLLLHKPAGVDVSAGAEVALQLIHPESRVADDRSGLRLLKRHLTGLTMTDVLDKDASGLLVFTQDWHIARKLVDDAVKIEQEFIVEVKGELMPNGLQLLNHGLPFNGKPLPPIKVSWQNETRLRFALKGVQAGQIAHMCRMVGLTIVSMKRLRIGRVPLAGLVAGQWRYLLGYERF